jgi:hypothetical protein
MLIAAIAFDFLGITNLTIVEHIIEVTDLLNSKYGVHS